MRSILLAAASVGLVLGAAACGGSDGDSSTSSTGDTTDVTANEVTSTAFNTVPPTSTTLPPTTSAPLQPGDVIPTESTYTIQANDYPSTVAAKFKVDMAALLELNGLQLEGNQVPGWPLPGQVIKIPAGATVPNPDGSSATEPPSSDGATDGTGGGSDASAAPTTIDVCAVSEYEIQPGDAPSTVAAKFDTTIDALAAANADNPNYAKFIAGFKIKIPAKTDC